MVSAVVAQTAVLDSLWQDYRQAKHDTTAILRLAALGQNYYTRHPDSSRLLSLEALRRARAIGYVRGEADALVSFSAPVQVSGSLDSALQLMNQGLALYESIAYRPGIERVLNNRAGIYYQTDKYEAALSDLQEIYQLALAAGETKRLGGLMHNMGIVQKARGERVVALKNLLQALEYRKQAQDTLNMALTYQMLGSLYSEMQQYDRAEKMYRQARERYEAQGEKVMEVYITYNMGKLLMEKGQPDSAMTVLQQGLTYANTLNMPDEQASFKAAIANIYRDKGLFESAEDLYQTSIGIYRSQENKSSLSMTLVDYAKLIQARGDLYTAEQLGKEAFGLAKQIGYPQACLESSSFLATLSEQANHPAAALTYLKESNFWRDSLESAQIAMQLQSVQMEYELQLAEQESQMALLEKEKEMQVMTGFLQRRWLIGLIVAIIIVSLLGFVLYRLYRQKRIVNRKLAENVAQLHENSKQLENANLSLGTTVQQLKLTNNKLEQFAFAASHDLKESVRSITSFSQLLVRQTPASQRRQHEYLDYIVNGGRRMQKTLNNLLQYNNLTFETKLENSVDVDAVINMVLSTLQKNPNFPALTLSRDTFPRLRTERIQLEQLYYNLIENCLHYRQPGEPLLVHIGVEEEGDTTVFYVRDNGIGVEPNYLENIFEPFFRLHDRERSGSGLGLAICQRIVDIYGGTIWAELPDEGGMLVKFTLPLAKVTDTNTPLTETEAVLQK